MPGIPHHQAIPVLPSQSRCSRGLRPSTTPFLSTSLGCPAPKKSESPIATTQTGLKDKPLKMTHPKLSCSPWETKDQKPPCSPSLYILIPEHWKAAFRALPALGEIWDWFSQTDPAASKHCGSDSPHGQREAGTTGACPRHSPSQPWAHRARPNARMQGVSP